MLGNDNHEQFAIIRDVEAGCVVLYIFGDVDLSTVGALKEAIDETATAGDSLLIDLSKCRYFDSSGLAALIQARNALGGKLTILVDPKSQVSRVMHLVGFDKLFNVVSERQSTRDVGGVTSPKVYDPSFIRSPHVVPGVPAGIAPTS